MRMYVFVALAALTCSSAGASSCSADEIPDSLEACLDGVRNTVVDKDRYWFGNDFITKCGPNPSGWFTGDCFNPMMRAGMNVKDILNIDPSGVDRFLNITFTSQPGNYTGCDHTFIQKETKEIVLDPLSMDTVSPWDVRAAPAMSWEPADGKLYTLAVVDVANGVLHGLFVNILGGDVSAGETIKPYHGPKNANAKAQLYIFLLYEQPDSIQVSNEWMMKLNAWSMQNPFKIADFTSAYSLTGPKGINNMPTWYDRYSVNMMMQLGISNNCVPFVTQAWKSEGHTSSFIPADPSLSIFLRIHFENKEETFTYCCQTQTYDERMFYLDPTGNSLVTAAETRSSNPVKVFLNMNKSFPNTTMDFKGKKYTLLAVDPDVPFDTVGTKDRPLLHWLAINNQVNGNGELEFGTVLQTYAGPLPPDDKTHVYYFMLYEQMNGQSLTINSTIDYTVECAVEPWKTRCLFNVTKLTRDNDLNLVGLSWMTSNNDDFVNKEYNFVCKGREDYRSPCDSSPGENGGGNRLSSVFSTFIVLLVGLICWY